MKEHEHIYPKMLWVFFAVFFIGVFICVFQSKPVIMGDGAEYILHTAAIQNHGSLDIRPEDVKRASEEFYGLESILQSMYDTRHGFHETAEGWLYLPRQFLFYWTFTLYMHFLLQMPFYGRWQSWQS